MSTHPSLSTLLGGILMIAGCCIGAGMLGLPLVTACAGFIPTIVLFAIAWLFMLSTGLLVLETNLWTGVGTNLMTMAEDTLGKPAKYLTAFLFIFLFYCLLVAYMAGGGQIISELPLGLSAKQGTIALTLIFGCIVYLGTRVVDWTNRLLMIGLGISFIALLAIGFPHVELSRLSFVNWGVCVAALPAMIISFGYHNMIPSLNKYLQGNVKGLKTVILIGSVLPLIIYLIWDGLILGLIPHDLFRNASQEGLMVSAIMREAANNPNVITYARDFSFYALVTSFITIALSFVDFLADGFQIKKVQLGKLLLCMLVLVPPFVFALVFPNIFISALNYAGAFGAVLLFGILPVAMVWKGRYIQHRQGPQLVPGGKPMLLLIGAAAIFVFLMQVYLEVTR